jgi:hypothetical protein
MGTHGVRGNTVIWLYNAGNTSALTKARNALRINLKR